MLLPALVALAAAVAFGWSTAAMHASASRTPEGVVGAFATLWHLVRQRRWLSGMAASLSGLALHSLALRLGSIAVVQPLVVTNLVFTFLFRALLDRQLPPRAVTAWAGVAAVGLAAFLVISGSGTGTDEPHGRGAAVLLLVGGVVAAGCWRASLRATPAATGLLLGTAAGIVFGMIAGTLKAAAGSSSVLDLVTSWPLYVLLLLGAAGFATNQTAYKRAPLTSSVPVLNVVNPVVALVFGVVAYSERPASGVLAVTGQALSLALVLVGVFFLARQEHVAQEPPLVPAL